jgi:hypothetical protein
MVTHMPSHLHEALIELFRHRPQLAAELLVDPLGVSVPAHQQVRVHSGELTDLSPTEYRADAVVTLTDADTPVLAVVVEAQLGRDPDKRRSWPVYLATLHARLRCPAVLLVVCTDAGTATWCATPIPVGHPGFVLRPLVLGPEQLPVVTDVTDAGRSPELAVLSAIAHGMHPARDKVLHALLGALDTMDLEPAALYADVVLAALPAAARHYLEALMTTGTYEYQSDFARRYFRQGKAEGEAEGEAKALLAFLSARGIEVPDDARARITECTDLDQLDTWIRRAATAGSVDELFD